MNKIIRYYSKGKFGDEKHKQGSDPIQFDMRTRQQF